MSIKTRLVLTFDAFGTLFRPKQAIGKTYADVASKHGLPAFPERHLNGNFAAVFSRAQQEHPNYGKASAMGAEQWWTNIIELTFEPMIKRGNLPREMISDLLRIFSTAEGYELYPDVLPFFTALRNFRFSAMKRQKPDSDIVVGIITNSDNRVPSILQSLSLRVAERQFLPDVGRDVLMKKADNDLAFIISSYDVGAEKPDRRIFDAAKVRAALPDEEGDVKHIYMHVGDDPVKDCQAAKQAGWEGVCLGGFGRNHGREHDPESGLFMSDLIKLNHRVFRDLLRT